MKKATGVILVILGCSIIAFLFRVNILRLAAGRSPEYIQLYLGITLGFALLNWGSKRIVNWAMTIGLALVLFGVFTLAKAFLNADAPGSGVPTTPIKLELRLISDSHSSDYTAFTLRGTTELINVENTTQITEKNFRAARVVSDNGSFNIEVQSDRMGTRLLSRLTASNIGRKLGILIDEELVVAPVIKQRIPLGNFEIKGDFTKEEASIIVHRINGDTDLISAAKPTGILTGLIFLGCGSFLFLLRKKIPDDAMTRLTGVIFLILGASAMFIAIIDLVLSITSDHRIEWPFLVILLCGYALLLWGARLFTSWRAALGLICIVLCVLLVILPAMYSSRYFPMKQDALGWTSRLILGSALVGIGAALIALWQRKRRSLKM